MLIPQPRSATYGPGSFTLTERSTVDAPAEIAELLRELIGPATGLPLPDHPALVGAPYSAPGDNKVPLQFTVDPGLGLGAEGYRLRVDESGVRASATNLAGLRWAAQTLRQLLPVEVFAPTTVATREWTVPHVDVVDEPRYAWRGAMIDVARWYKPVWWLRRFVDLVAMHRMNVVHLHLTDDQGWRFQVQRYPRLTDVGAYRRESPRGHEAAGVGDGTPHGGWYTQDDLRHLVHYAARRGVTIVPEIDLPGHTQAVVAAYPELGNDPAARHEVWTRFGVSPHILNADDATLEFMRHVLDEVMRVFPSPYIHLGGDEVPPQEWLANPNAQKRMADLGIQDHRDLLSWWVGQIGAHVAAGGRTPVVWDELVGTGPQHGVVIMAWRGHDRVAEALNTGHRVVATPHTHMYLNYPQSDAPGEPLSIADGGPATHEGVTTLSATYGYDPGPPPGVLGMQANLWTEYAPTPGRAEYDLMPRLAAVAELGWGTAGDEGDLRRRLLTHLRRLDHAGITYRPLDP